MPASAMLTWEAFWIPASSVCSSADSASIRSSASGPSAGVRSVMSPPPSGSPPGVLPTLRHPSCPAGPPRPAGAPVGPRRLGDGAGGLTLGRSISYGETARRRSQMTMTNRRGFLAGCGAAALAGAAGCRGGQQQSEGTAVDASVLPSYQPFEGAEPDLPGEVDRCSPAFFGYPADPPRFATEPPGDGAPVTAM